jgi:diguanylate cyclase (GGDEF)-like protein
MAVSARSRLTLNRLRRATAWRSAHPRLQKWAALLGQRTSRLNSTLRRTLDAGHFEVGRIATGLARGWRSLRRRLPGRSLILEILALQLLVSMVIGGLAIVGLWWTSTWAIEDNLKRWGQRWIGELDDLGVPIFAADNPDGFLQIESYISSFPEISFVRYYGPGGELVFEDNPGGESGSTATLDAGYLSQLADLGVAEEARVLENPADDSSLVRISKPVWTQAFQGDGLIGIDLTDSDNVRTELVGFVELGLNFDVYQAQLSRNIVVGSIFGILLLVLLTSASGVFFRRALKPLSSLQKPLRKLAEGDTDFSVQSSGHAEIRVIADALNTTVSSLNERDKKLWQLANHDSLTGLMNRHQFGEKLIEEIGKVKQHGFTSALLFVDLDQFKYVNDTLGHAAGDRLLKQAAEHVRHAIRKDDIVSRFGGDEFTILLSDVTEKDVKAVCNGLLQDMRDYHFHDSGHTFNVPCSIGVVMIRADELSPAELLARADLACHEAKTRGRNRFQIYRASGVEMRQMAADVGWSHKIQQALKDDSFVIHYQPIVDVRTGQPTHYEVLLRMRADEKTLVPPAAFLPAASRFGLMTAVDEWVIRNALAALARFRATRDGLTFTLNISGNIFEDADLYECIEENLAKNSLPAECVVLEITEQVAVRNITTAAEQIAAISRLGCRFAIDDFGAGYSSYSYLKNLPVDYIKIDGSFIRNLAKDKVDQTIVGSISEISKATRKKTIAEHVKDAEAFGILHELGIDFAQGHYVGKPAARPSARKVAVPIAAAKRRRKKAG